MTGALVSGRHVYVSTACLHGAHEQCRATCKFCAAPCACPDCNHDPAPPAT